MLFKNIFLIATLFTAINNFSADQFYPRFMKPIVRAFVLQRIEELKKLKIIPPNNRRYLQRNNCGKVLECDTLNAFKRLLNGQLLRSDKAAGLVIKELIDKFSCRKDALFEQPQSLATSAEPQSPISPEEKKAQKDLFDQLESERAKKEANAKNQRARVAAFAQDLVPFQPAQNRESVDNQRQRSTNNF